MGSIGGIEHGLALVVDDRGGAVVHRCWGVQPDPGVAMFVVIPAGEGAQPSAGFTDGGEPLRVVGGVFHRLELGF